MAKVKVKYAICLAYFRVEKLDWHGEVSWLREDLGWSSEIDDCFFWNNRNSAIEIVKQVSNRLVIDESLFNVVAINWMEG